MRFVPREEKYFGLLTELMERVCSGAALFVELLADYDHRGGYANKIKAVEQECDRLAAEILSKLNTSFITPIDREDIYHLTTRSDDIIDAVNGLARRMEIVNAVPLRDDVPEIAGLLAESLVEVEAAFGQLEKRSGVAGHGKKIRELEERADTLYAEALHRLFTEETNAIEVVKWVWVYEQLEDAIDRCKHLAESLESIVVKHT